MRVKHPREASAEPTNLFFFCIRLLMFLLLNFSFKKNKIIWNGSLYL